MVEITDRSRRLLIPATCRAARALLGWTQEDLANASGVCRSTVREFENGHHGLQRTSAEAIAQALRQAGVEFINGPENAVGVCIKAES